MKIKCPKCASDDIYLFDNSVEVCVEDEYCGGRISCTCMTCEHDFRIYFDAKLIDLKISY